MEVHPKEGMRKAKVSRKISAFGAELTEKNRSMIAVHVTSVHDEARNADG